MTTPFLDLPREQRRIRVQGVLSVTLCAPVLAASIGWLPGRIAFPQELSERLAFALRADLFIFVWLVIAIGIVSTIRRYSADDIQGSGFGPPSTRLAIPAAFLQNTLEQVVVSGLAFLALATVEGEAPLAYIAGAIPLFAIGRIAFLRGYRHGAGGRAFGMVTTALPGLGALLWAAYDVVARLAGTFA